MNWGRYITVAIFTLILQLLIIEFFSIWPPLYIAALPFFIIWLPREVGPYMLMISAFILGLLTDVLADGVLGLNATSCCAVAFLKNFSRKASGDKMFAYFIISYAAFFLFYITLDSMGSGLFWFVVFRFILNVAFNSILAYYSERWFKLGILKSE